MPRRIVLLLAILALAIAAIAVAPWTTSSLRLREIVAHQLRTAYGLEMTVAGRSTIAVLPVPRLKFGAVTLATREGVPVITAGQVRGEIAILPLLMGRIQLSSIMLDRAHVAVDLKPDGSSPFDETWERLRLRAARPGGDPGHFARLVMTNSEIAIRDADRGTQEHLRDVNLVLRWPSPSAELDLSGTLAWRDQRLTVTAGGFHPDAVMAGRPSPFELQAKGAIGEIDMAGQVDLAGPTRITGESRFRTPSLADFVAWSGASAPLGTLIGPFSLAGDVSLAEGKLAWPAVQITLGEDRLDGTLSAQLSGTRPSVTATLAANAIDLSRLVAPLTQLRSPAGSWSRAAFTTEALEGGDLDLRLSATTARLGRLSLGDMGLSVLMRGNRVEFSLGRASLAKGVLKARALIQVAPEALDMKMQTSFERVDAAAFLAALGEPRWLSGIAQGQATFEGVADSPAELVRQSTGRASLTIRDGEITGISLEDALRRSERGANAGADWRGGSTAFEQAQLGLNLAAGVAELVDGTVNATTLRLGLSGSVSLARGMVAIKGVAAPNPAGTGAGAGRPAGQATFTFDVTGPLNAVAINPAPPPATPKP